MAQVDTQVLSRLLKVLDRSVKTGEDLDPFKYVTPPTGPPKSSPRKKVAKAKKQDASQPQPAKEGSDDIADQDTDRKSAEEEDREPEKELDRTDYEQLARSLNIARESILAADCCIALLGSDRLTKQVRSEVVEQNNC
jgi:cohesin loading factor subunit SCC2